MYPTVDGTVEVLDGVGATRASLDATRFLKMVGRVSPDR